jgi:hypothetical protein
MKNLLLIFLSYKLFAQENLILRKKLDHGFCFYAQDGDRYLSLNSTSLQKEDLIYTDLIWKTPLIFSGGIFFYSLYLKWKNYYGESLKETKAAIQVEQARTINEFLKQNKVFNMENKFQINSTETYHYDININQSKFFEILHVHLRSSAKTFLRRSIPLWEFLSLGSLILAGLLKILQIQRNQMIKTLFNLPEIKDLKINYPYGKVLSHIESHGEKCERRLE